MRKKIIICLVAMLGFEALSVGNANGENGGSTVVQKWFKGSSTSAQNGSSEPFPGWQKLDSGGKALWEKYKKTDDAILEVLIRTNQPVKKKQKRQFDLIGFKYRSIIPFQGSIVTGSIAIKNLQCLAALEFVDIIEAGAAVSSKESQRILKDAVPKGKK